MEAEMNEIDTKAISFKRLVLFTDKLLLSGYVAILFHLHNNEKKQPEEYALHLMIFNTFFAGLWFLVEVHSTIVYFMPGTHIKIYPSKTGHVLPIRGISKTIPCVVSSIPNLGLAYDNNFIYALAILTLLESGIHFIYFLFLDLEVNMTTLFDCFEGLENVEVKKARTRKKKVDEKMGLLEDFLTGKQKIREKEPKPNSDSD